MKRKTLTAFFIVVIFLGAGLFFRSTSQGLDDPTSKDRKTEQIQDRKVSKNLDQSKKQSHLLMDNFCIDTGGRYWYQTEGNIAYKMTVKNKKQIEMKVTILTPDNEELDFLVGPNDTDEFIVNEAKEGRYEIDFQNAEGNPEGTFSLEVSKISFSNEKAKPNKEKKQQLEKQSHLLIDNFCIDTGGRYWYQTEGNIAYKMTVKNEKPIEMKVTILTPDNKEECFVVGPNGMDELIVNKAKEGKYDIDFQNSQGNPKGTFSLEISKVPFPKME